MLNPIDGQTIRAARTALGITPKQLGAAMGVSASCVSNWETGRNGIQKRNFFLLCRILDLNPNGQESAVVEPSLHVAEPNNVEKVEKAEEQEEPAFSSSEKPLLLSLPTNLYEALENASVAEYRAIEYQAIWAIETYLHTHGYFATE